jgi:hypothetical protein
MSMYEDLARRCPTVLPAPPICGWDCPVGWQTLVVNLFVKIETVASGLKNPPVCEQLKTKFGALRCYMSRAVPEIAALIDEASSLSERLCEVCGLPGEQRRTKRGGVCVACHQHHKETR